jgi:hypothetical protein
MKKRMSFRLYGMLYERKPALSGKVTTKIKA